MLYTIEPAQFGNLLSQYRGTASQFFLFDTLGSTSQLTDINATVTDTYLYDAFGTIRVSSGLSTNGFRYVGSSGYYYNPDLSQYYLRARFYDPALGRFMSRDPLELSLDNLQAYVYVGNNPTNNTDPSGLSLFADGDAMVGPGGHIYVCCVAGTTGTGIPCNGSLARALKLIDCIARTKNAFRAGAWQGNKAIMDRACELLYDCYKVYY